MTPLRPRLIAITNAALVGVARLPELLEPWLERAAAGSVMVQLRDTELDVRQRLELGRVLLQRVRRHGQLLSVNDRIDLALVLGADGVHLGEAGVDPEAARALLPDGWISAAWHPASAPPRALADALVVSPVSAARKGRAALGSEGLALAVRVARTLEPEPLVYALGGIDASSAPACLAAGAWGIAAISAVLEARDPEPLLAALGILGRLGG